MCSALGKSRQLFEEQTGISVIFDVCSPHCANTVAEEAAGETGGDDFLLEISDAGIHGHAIPNRIIIVVSLLFPALVKGTNHIRI